MKNRWLGLTEEQGAVLIVMALLLLALLTIFGLSATRTAVIESRIATNHHLHKMAFYEAEGGTQIGMELIEDNIYHKGRNDGQTVEGITLDDGDFYLNAGLPVGVRPNRENRVAHYPAGDSDCPFTRLMIGGVPSPSTGGALQMFNGYSSAGRAAGRGGTWIVYDIRSQHCGRRNNESIVELFYRHVL